MISIQSYRLSIVIFQFNFKKFKVKNSTYGDKTRGNRGKYKCNLILIFFLLGVCINNSFSKICQVTNNKINHSLDGNISKKGTLTLFTWNKGNSTFENKRDEILVTIERYKPDIFAIHEANFDFKSILMLRRTKRESGHNISFLSDTSFEKDN